MRDTTLHAALDKVAADSPEVVVGFPAERIDLRLDTLSRDSARVAARFRDLGVGAGDRVGVLCTNEPDFLLVLFALSRLGACVCPLPLPTRADDGGYVAKAQSVLVDGGVRDVVVSRRLRRYGPFLDEVFQGVRRIPAEELLDLDAAVDGVDGDGVTADRDIILQYTSGSTANPKGVRLTHRNVQTCMQAIRTGIDLPQPGDRTAIWLPLFHDMGLFGTLTSILTGVSATVWQPAAFVKDPANWLREFADGGYTIAPLPNFGYDYLLRAVEAEEVTSYDLSRWRVAFNGAEPIAVDSVEAFLTHFAPAGFVQEAMMPVYGLAEATLAVTFPPLRRGPRAEWVDRASLSDEGVAVPVARDVPGARGLLSVGMPVLGMEVRVGDADGAPVPDRTVGEVQIRGGSVTEGYVDDEGAVTQPFTPDGWLRTGDLGYLADGELFVTGRSKEMIIIRGANFYPDDVESAVRNDPAVHRRRCVAFVDDRGDAERMVLVAETTADAGDHPALAARLRGVIRSATGLDDVHVVPVAPRSIPRTSSGKLQRLATRSLFR
ncbi:AMP-binding protein [Actinophytocola glycyrrhizae]|uniref:AMP-binding protein n=1 Tax=Actinophytocola glycyrrhizae TaxID=2044873 RepID=A0ABV9S6F0_9PSEU